MDLNINGRRALVTGASTGIGAGVAIALAREGVLLALSAQSMEALSKTATAIEAEGFEKPTLIPASLTDAADTIRLSQEATNTLGHIDILANCAGGSRPTPLDADEAFWAEAFDLNFHAPRRLTHALLPTMQSNQWGRIINISGSMEPRSLNAAIAAKGALHLWSKGVSCDVAKDGVTINCVAPGRINSPQILEKLYPDEASRQNFIEGNIPTGAFGDPEDLACMVAFLCSPQAHYITGTVIPVNGGMHYFAH